MLLIYLTIFLGGKIKRPHSRQCGEIHDPYQRWSGKERIDAVLTKIDWILGPDVSIGLPTEKG